MWAQIQSQHLVQLLASDKWWIWWVKQHCEKVILSVLMLAVRGEPRPIKTVRDLCACTHILKIAPFLLKASNCKKISALISFAV